MHFLVLLLLLLPLPGQSQNPFEAALKKTWDEKFVGQWPARGILAKPLAEYRAGRRFPSASIYFLVGPEGSGKRRLIDQAATTLGIRDRGFPVWGSADAREFFRPPSVYAHSPFGGFHRFVTMNQSYLAYFYRFDHAHGSILKELSIRIRRGKYNEGFFVAESERPELLKLYLGSSATEQAKRDQVSRYIRANSIFGAMSRMARPDNVALFYPFAVAQRDLVFQSYLRESRIVQSGVMDLHFSSSFKQELWREARPQVKGGGLLSRLIGTHVHQPIAEYLLRNKLGVKKMKAKGQVLEVHFYSLAKPPEFWLHGK